MARGKILAVMFLACFVGTASATDGIVKFKRTRKDTVQSVKAKLVTVEKVEKVFDEGNKVVGYELTLRPVGATADLPGSYKIGTSKITWRGARGAERSLDPATFKRGTKLAVVLGIKKGGGEQKDMVVLQAIFDESAFVPE